MKRILLTTTSLVLAGRSFLLRLSHCSAFDVTLRNSSLRGRRAGAIDGAAAVTEHKMISSPAPSQGST